MKCRMALDTNLKSFGTITFSYFDYARDLFSLKITLKEDVFNIESEANYSHQ